MFVLVRDEDVPTVAAAVNQYASDEGLEIAPPDAAESANPLALLAALGNPRAFVSTSGDNVVLTGLESLDIADPDEWARHLSTVLSTEVVALAVADDGVRVFVFAEGEEEEEIEVPLSPSGRSPSPALAELADGDEEREALEAGLVATSPEELAQGILRCLGVTGLGEDTVALAFVDPLEEDETAAPGEPALEVAALAGAELATGVGEPLVTPLGYVFAVSLAGGGEGIEGLTLALGGTALALVAIDAIEVAFRVRGAHERTTRRLPVTATAEATLEATITDAYLERVDLGTSSLDFTDMFSSMQRLVSATETQQLNTLFVGVSARGRAAGSAELVLTASPIAGSAAAGQGTIAIEVRGGNA
jgi:hypothetical protein